MILPTDCATWRTSNIELKRQPQCATGACWHGCNYYELFCYDMQRIKVAIKLGSATTETEKKKPDLTWHLTLRASTVNCARILSSGWWEENILTVVFTASTQQKYDDGRKIFQRQFTAHFSIYKVGINQFVIYSAKLMYVICGSPKLMYVICGSPLEVKAKG